MAGTKQPPKVKAHSYFAKHRPSEWNVVAFLDEESVRRGTHFNFAQTLSAWNSSLRHLAVSGKGDQVATAEQKLTDYYKASPGSLSDKTRAGNWRDSRKREKLNHSTTPEPPPVSLQNNYYGPVINGTVHRSTITSNTKIPGGALVDTCAGPSHAEYVEYVEENADADPGSNSVLAEPIANVDDERLEDICLSLQELRNIMVDTFDLPSGWTLEDRLVLYASRLTQLDPTHCFIVDEKMLSALGKRDRKHMLDQVQPLPTFPKVLNSLVDKYKGVTTVPQCREIAGASVDGDELWISRVLEHMVELIKYDVLLYDLGEGVLDSLVNPVFWDNNFIRIPGMIIVRKEITLLSMKYQPYQYLNYEPRFDGVVRTRPGYSGEPYELGLFEVSSKFGPSGTDALKWDKDRTKLIAGCRAMLYRLKELVNNDDATVKKLRVVGVLQAGLHIQLFIMSFINGNVLYLRAGNVWEIPTTYESLGLVFNVITIAWKAKRVIMDTSAAITSYLEEDAKAKGRRPDRVTSEWL